MNMFSSKKSLIEGYEELSRRLEAMEHEQKMLKLEWEEAYEKIANTLRKLGRRAEVLQKEMDGGKPPLSADEQVLAGMRDPRAGNVDSETRQRAMDIVLKRRGGNGGLLR